MATFLRFKLAMEPGNQNPLELFNRFMPGGRYMLNRTEWRGKEPRSCALTGVSTRAHSVGSTSPLICDIQVTYRPKGHISYVGSTKYDGWTAMVLDRSVDPPVYVPQEVYDDFEFNDLDLGEFVDESEIEAVRHVSRDAVMKEIMDGGSFSISIHGSFIAPRRSRPLTKIILSSQPTGEGVDGFGTHILNINNATPNLEQVVADALTKLMCDFIEGKASIKNAGNDDLAIVDLSDSLVDCAPNEDGFDSLFDVMRFHTSPDFLENLSKQLMSTYAVEVAVVDGEHGGLAIRRERKHN